MDFSKSSANTNSLSIVAFLQHIPRRIILASKIISRVVGNTDFVAVETFQGIIFADGELRVCADAGDAAEGGEEGNCECEGREAHFNLYDRIRE